MSSRLLLNSGQMEAVIRDERDRRRRVRLDQVRSRSRQNAAMIIARVAASRRRQLDTLRTKLEEEWKTQKRDRLEALGAEYGECLRHVGKGHRSVALQIHTKASDRQQLQDDRKEAALTRGHEALAKLSAERTELHRRLLERSTSRELVRRAEDERAKHVASLPPPPSTLPPNMASSGTVPIITATSNDAKTDAREAARLEEARLKRDEVDGHLRASAQSVLERKRFQKANVKMELQREYNQIMDDLAKIAELEKSSDDDVNFIDSSDAKARLIAKREAVVEELFDKFSIIPLVPSRDSSNAKDSAADDYSCVIHHVLLSDDSLDDQIASIVASGHESNGASTFKSTSGRSASSFDEPKSSLRIDDDETILVSHPVAYVSSVDIDLSSYAFDDESSSESKLPPSTLNSNGNGSLLSPPTRTESPPSTSNEHDVAMIVDRPIFHNVQVKQYALRPAEEAAGAPDKVGRHPPPLRGDVLGKRDQLHRLLDLAVQNRREVDHKKTGRSPMGLASGLADLRDSFLKAQANLEAELERHGRKVDLLFGTNGRRPQSQHALSTIVEVDSPEDSLGHVINEIGITSEPDLTLVSGASPGSYSSRSSSPLHRSKRCSTSSDSSTGSSDSWSNGFLPWTLTSSAASTTLPSLSISACGRSQKSICLSHFFDTGTELEGRSVTSCPVCQSSISGSEHGQSDEGKLLSASPLLQTSSSCDDSLYSFLKHEMSANNADSSSSSNALN